MDDTSRLRKSAITALLAQQPDDGFCHFRFIDVDVRRSLRERFNDKRRQPGTAPRIAVTKRAESAAIL